MFIGGYYTVTIRKIKRYPSLPPPLSCSRHPDIPQMRAVQIENTEGGVPRVSPPTISPYSTFTCDV